MQILSDLPWLSGCISISLGGLGGPTDVLTGEQVPRRIGRRLLRHPLPLTTHPLGPYVLAHFTW